MYFYWYELAQRRIDGPTPPYAEPIFGDLWYDTVNDVLKVCTNNLTWVAVCDQCNWVHPTNTSPSTTPTPTGSVTLTTPTPTPT